MLFVASDLERFDIKYADLEKAEKYETKKYPDGSWEIKYTYDSRKYIDVTPLRLVCKVVFRKSEDRAKSLFKNLVIAFKGSKLFGEMVIEEDSKLFEWGDQCFAAFIKNNVSKVGNYIIVRERDCS